MYGLLGVFVCNELIVGWIWDVLLFGKFYDW